MVRSAYTLRPEDDDFSQPNALVNQVMDEPGGNMAETVASTLGTVRPDIAERVYEYWRNVDKDPGRRHRRPGQRPGRRAARTRPGRRRPRHPREQGRLNP